MTRHAHPVLTGLALGTYIALLFAVHDLGQAEKRLTHLEQPGTVSTRPTTASPPSPVPRARRSPSEASRSRPPVPHRPWQQATASATGSSLNWPALAECESSSDPHALSPSGRYRGLYQFDAETWRSVGGTGDPAAATPAEQTARARLLYAQRGREPWPVCGRFL